LMKRKLDVQPLPAGEPSQSRPSSSSSSSSRNYSSAPAKMSDPFFYKPYEPSAPKESDADTSKPEEKKVGITPAKPAVGALLGGFKKK